MARLKVETVSYRACDHLIRCTASFKLVPNRAPVFLLTLLEGNNFTRRSAGQHNGHESWGGERDSRPLQLWSLCDRFILPGGGWSIGCAQSGGEPSVFDYRCACREKIAAWFFGKPGAEWE